MKHLQKWLALLLIAALFLTGCAVEVVPSYSEQAEKAPAQAVFQTEETTAAAEETVPVTEETEETTIPETEETTVPETEAGLTVSEDGEYTSKEEVALYLHLYGHLPSNYITKKEAEALGWGSTYKTLDKAAPGKSIGGTYFGNYEKLLPTAKGRKYSECDIDYRKGSRNAKRIVYSNDGLIYYTEDHYQTFELLYGEV